MTRRDTPGPGIRILASVRRAAAVVLLPLAAAIFPSAILAPQTAAADQAAGMLQAAGAGPVRVLESTRQGLRIGVETGELSWKRHELRGGDLILEQPVLEGFAPAGEAAGPLLPAAGAWIVIPPGTEPSLRQVSAEWRDLDRRRLMVAATPVFRREGGESVLVSELLLPGEKPLSGEAVVDPGAGRGPAAGQGLTLGEPVAWRGRRIAAVTVRPVRADASGRAAACLESGEWAIDFVRTGDPEPTGGAAVSGDSRFSGMFLNGEALSSWPRESASRRDRFTALAEDGPALAPGPLLQPEIRLPVTRTRFHEVGEAALRSAGLLTAAAVREDQIRVYQRRYDPESATGYREIEVPIDILGDGGDFTDGESFIFYGLRCRDDEAFVDGQGVDQPAGDDIHEVYNPADGDDVNGGNIYYLAFRDADAGAPWARIEGQGLSEAAGPPLASYRRVDYFEEDVNYNIYPEPDRPDHYHWNATFDSSVDVAFPVWSPVTTAVDDTVRVGLGGNVELRCVLESDAGPDTLGSIHASSAGGTLVAAVGGDVLAREGLSLRVTRVGSSIIWGWLDWFSVSYEAEYRAIGDELEFNGGEAAGPRPIEVAGFGDPQINLYEITDPRRPVRVDLLTENVVADGDSWKLSLSVAQDGTPRRFWAHAGPLSDAVSDLSTFRFSRVEEPADLLAASTAPDVLVITHPDFRSALDPWLDHRRARSAEGLEFLVADVHAVYDQFGGGLRSPEAIKRFVQAAIDKPGWSPWALVLVGDANENGRNLRAPAGQRDWVPSRMHAWSYGSYANELLPSDKWYANSAATTSYPNDSYAPPEMMVGRFPCNSAAELSDMVAKVAAFENATGETDWKRRAVFLADDLWSSGYSVQDLNTKLTPTEAAFRQTEEEGAAGWDTLAAGGLETVRIYVADYLDPLVTPPDAVERDDKTFRGHARDYVTLPVLLPELSKGASLFHYQGHANSYLLAHEHVIEDMVGAASLRQDISSIANAGKPFVFMGLGCHIAAWALDAAERSNAQAPSLGEKMLRLPGAGACAVYASPGYEFLQSNADFVSLKFDSWFNRPPRSGDPARSRWVLGEMLLQAESEYLAVSSYLLNNRRMVAQYHLLGDPLMTIDCGPPLGTVSLDGAELADGSELTAPDAANVVSLEVRAWDEAGVAGLEVADSDGGDTGAVISGGVPAGAQNDQYAVWTVDLPVRPFDHEVVFSIRDTGDVPGDEHFEFDLKLPQSFDLYLDGVPVAAGEVEFPPAGSLSFSGEVATAAWIAEDAVLELTGRNLDLAGVQLERAGPHVIDIAFDAALAADFEPGVNPAVILSVDGFETEFVLSGGDVEPAAELVSIPHAFPNPLRDGTRIVFRAGADWSRGKVVLFSVAGRRVAEIPVPAGAAGEVSVSWDGRDRSGDRLANGVYLYRVELDTAVGAASSGMQRLVVMR